MRRVAVTGIGLVTPLAVGTDETWNALLACRSAIGPVTRFDASSLRTRLAAEANDFDPKPFVAKPRTLRMMTRGDQFAFAAAALALQDAGCDAKSMDGDRFALYAGSNKEIPDPDYFRDAVLASRLPDGTVDHRRFAQAAFSSVYPLFYVEGLPGAALFFISEAYGLTGPNSYFAGTAEAGMVALGSAFRAIRRGEADVALAGGFDDPISWWNFSKLDAMGVLSDRNDDGPAACRPFDRRRSGSVLGEGAAFLFLEWWDAAEARAAHIYAEVAGFGNEFDPSGFPTPAPDGPEVARAIRAALREARVDPAAVGYIAAHGSATRLGDASEARGIRAALGSAAERSAGSSVKASTGHLVGAAGALNAAIAALAIDRGMIPPTLNLEVLDPECRFDWVAGEARDAHVDVSLAVARGMEGQAVTLALTGTDRRGLQA